MPQRIKHPRKKGNGSLISNMQATYETFNCSSGLEQTIEVFYRGFIIVLLKSTFFEKNIDRYLRRISANILHGLCPPCVYLAPFTSRIGRWRLCKGKKYTSLPAERYHSTLVVASELLCKKGMPFVNGKL